LFLKYVFKVAPANICLVGRWLRYMPEGIFRHSTIVSAPKKSGECAAGWLAHYTIGVTFVGAFFSIAGDEWLQRPTLVPALLFGVATVLAPFFIMQPAFGFGFAASKAANPKQARVRSLMNHLAFGFGLYFFGLLVDWLFRLLA
jgi:hypothetical protein